MAESPIAPSVEVVYATPDEQRIVSVPLEPGMTAERAVELSGLADVFPEIRVHALVLGIFGSRVAPDQRLRAGDRVEICRPLRVDPRTMRRILLASGKVMGGVKTEAAK